jgi:anti-sigma-K factor RskA
MHNEKHDPITELIPAYALGALDADEAAVVTLHLATCTACQTELAAYKTVVDALPHAVIDSEPSPALKGRLMERVQASSKTETTVSPSTSWWQPIANALQNFLTGPRWKPALAIAAVVVLIGAFFFWQQAKPAMLEQVELTATDIAPDAEGVIEITANGRDAILTVAGLPTLPPEQQYQLWLIEDGQRASGAIFSVNDNGWAKVTVDSERPLTEYGAFGITIEPAGGSPGPTGKRVLGHNL